MPLTRRYTPEIPPGEQSLIGMDFSYVIPPGVGITSGTVALFTNVATPAASTDMTLGAVTVRGRTLYAQITALAAALGNDYQVRWQATDSQGNIWPRTGLLLCAQTS